MRLDLRDMLIRLTAVMPPPTRDGKQLEHILKLNMDRKRLVVAVLIAAEPDFISQEVFIEEEDYGRNAEEVVKDIVRVMHEGSPS